MAVQHARHDSLACVDFHVCPVRVSAELLRLHVQVRDAPGEDLQIVGVRQAAACMLQLQVSAAGQRPKLVPPATHMQPSEQGLNVDEEQEGGQRVALQRAPVHRQLGGGAVPGLVCGGGIGVDVLDHLDCIGGKAQVIHELQGQIMVCHVEGR